MPEWAGSSLAMVSRLAKSSTGAILILAEGEVEDREEDEEEDGSRRPSFSQVNLTGVSPRERPHSTRVRVPADWAK